MVAAPGPAPSAARVRCRGRRRAPQRGPAGPGDGARDHDPGFAEASLTDRAPPSAAADRPATDRPATDGAAPAGAPPEAAAAQQQARAARQRGDLAAALAALEPAADARPAHIGLQVEAAEVLRLLGRLDAAEARLEAALALAPSHPWALAGLGQVARARGDQAGALARFAAASEALPDQPALHVERGRALLDLGRPEAAEAAYQAALALDPREARALDGLGWIARRRGDTALALERFEAALAANPDALFAAVNAADTATSRGEHARALTILDQALARRPGHAELLLARGRAARAAGEQAAARTALTAAAEAARGDLRRRALAELAQLDLDGGDRAAAEAPLRRLHAESPGDPAPLRQLAHLARRAGDRAAALAWFESARERAPEDAGLLVEAAEELRALDRPAEATERLEQALALAPGHPWAQAGLGQMARAAGDAAAALARFAAASAALPESQDLRIEHAQSLVAVGRAPEAAALYEAVLAAEPRNARALDGLAWIRRNAGDLAGAIPLFEAAMEERPEELWPGLNLARALAEAGETGRAAATLDRIAARHGERLEVALLRGTLARQSGDRPGAVAAFRAAAAAHPGAVEPLLELAQAEIAAGAPAEAEAALRRAVAVDGGAGPRAPMALGWMLQLAHRHEEALACFRAAAALPGGEVHGRIGAAAALLGLGDHDAALAELGAASPAAAGDPELIAQRVQLLTEVGDWPAARAAAEAGRVRHPGHFGLWARRLRLALRADPIETQARLLEEVPPGPPADQAVAAELRGWVAANAWAHDAAAEAFAEAIRLQPDAVEPHQHLARMGLLRLRLREARRDLGAYAERARGFAALQGRRVQASQHLLGHLLDEFDLDAPLRDRLAAVAARQPAALRIAPLRTAMAENPDSTAAAVALLLALRQAGSLGRAAAAPTPPAGGTRDGIPRRISQFWHAEDPPPDVAAMMQGWRAANPEALVHRFDDATAVAWLARHQPPAVLAAYRRLREPAMRADLLRLALLHAEGGFWADADDRALAPVAALAPPGVRFLSYQQEYGTVGNNFLGVVPRHPVIGRALRQAVQAIARGDSDVAWLSTGPGLLTRALAQHIAEAEGPVEAVLQGIRILEAWELGGTVAMHCAASYRSGRPATPARPRAEPAHAG